ncbi:DUF2927 domain-containing protein [Plastorhodobacter daqingensis]|uniref:DUF2927 domain-containing protein n=1 Tax=Plastorhodobacter daqingensis TaxID=1387281 RepID=A0ABW2UIJ4_9RHOB
MPLGSAPLARAPKALAAATMLFLAACEVAPPPEPMPPPTAPKARPERIATPALPPVSQELRAYYQAAQDELLAQGMMRTDRGGPDAPFNERQLIENFVQIALYDEYSRIGGRLVARPVPSRLRRWEQPVRMSVIFGETVPAAQQARDRAEIGRYTQRLAELTGLSIQKTEADANFHVLILNEEERRAFAPRLRELVPGIDDMALRTITGLPRQTFCVVFSFSRGGASTYAHAIAVVRAEHPDLLRQSCIHEELAQGLGLANDSPLARPSIFNDNEEFALLTHHDELLLQMLYDPRLRPGMTEATARPILQVIARELMGGES